MPRVKTILCPVDFSESSSHALDYAVDLAAKLDAKIHVLHVVELLPYSLPDGAVGADLPARFRDEITAQLEELAARAAPRASTQLIVQGIPYREIVRVATELPADLIVIGTHGRSGVVRMLLGSVAERVLRTATVPVVTVPPRAS